MRSIRFRLRFLFLSVLTCMGIFAYETWAAYEDMRQTHEYLNESIDLRQTVMTVAFQEFSDKAKEKLQRYRRKLQTEQRRTAMSNLIQAYSEGESKLLSKRVQESLEIERQFYLEILRRDQLISARVEKFALLTLVLPVATLILLMFFIRTSIFRSLDRLSQRMLDFLVDRYSFQLTEPEANEFGDLQKTFNSLAQRVINNMDELKNLDRAKSEFLSIASHELRTPLTSIKGSLSLLTSGVMGNLDVNSLRLIKIAETETDRLIRLINDLLDLAKIEAGKLPLACDWVAWDDLMKKISESLMGLSHRAKVGLITEPVPGLEVFIDRDRLQQVLTNLISNAVKFSPEGSSVIVRAAQGDKGELQVEVIDHGCGISAEDQDVIFQKFRQGSNESTVIQGTGLGLAIAKALVEEHGGVIGLESDVNQGSTFYFTLPRWRDAHNRNEGEAA